MLQSSMIAELPTGATGVEVRPSKTLGHSTLNSSENKRELKFPAGSWSCGMLQALLVDGVLLAVGVFGSPKLFKGRL